MVELKNGAFVVDFAGWTFGRGNADVGAAGGGEQGGGDDGGERVAFADGWRENQFNLTLSIYYYFLQKAGDDRRFVVGGVKACDHQGLGLARCSGHFTAARCAEWRFA